MGLQALRELAAVPTSLTTWPLLCPSYTGAVTWTCQLFFALSICYYLFAGLECTPLVLTRLISSCPLYLSLNVTSAEGHSVVITSTYINYLHRTYYYIFSCFFACLLLVFLLYNVNSAKQRFLSLVHCCIPIPSTMYATHQVLNKCFSNGQRNISLYVYFQLNFFDYFISRGLLNTYVFSIFFSIFLTLFDLLISIRHS